MHRMNDALVDTWRINARLNLDLLDALSPEQYEVKTPKGKAVASHFSHMHFVRLMWLKAAATDLLKGLDKEDGKACSLSEIRAALEQSEDRIATLIERAETPEGPVRGFKPHCAAFVGYLVAHESYHRAQAELGLRQAGLPLTDKIAYRMWEWGGR